MLKYTFVVLTRDREAFLHRLRDLGLVDVTVSDWEPGAADRELMVDIDERSKAVEYLSSLPKAENPIPANGTVNTDFDAYTRARARIAELETSISTNEKLAAELLPLGEFDADKLLSLVDSGVPLETFGLTAVPEKNYRQVEQRVAEMKTELAQNQATVASTDIDGLRAEIADLKDRLNFSRATTGGESAVEGELLVIEGWARADDAGRVEASLSDTLFLRERPRPQDEVPVVLSNGGFAAPFEFIGNLYAKPRYGRMDLTRWFAPFFMLFFGLCLADFGYGVVILTAGFAGLVFAGPSLRPVFKLTTFCGAAATVVGFVMGSAFGVEFKGWEVFAPVRGYFIDSDQMFYIAIGIGIFQVMFAMVLKIVTTVRAFGVRYALADAGWLVVLVSSIAIFLLGFEGLLWWGFFGAGVVLMLFFNSPGKNPVVNFAGGLWETFNRLTGILGDALSYIRLFAIGLSGGVLAMVFNRIALEVSPDIPVLGVLVTLVLLLFGHVLNLFMSVLSAVVHPLRLTFVEFFGNAGFEAATREFDPLRKLNSKK